ncbi:hypothetical protein GQ53DRAFT_55861 [Thozetella sp. PMI_491]|nr:hypothetical protein GQ53DRAFT_55861 [Thozetella sp. PMI_491]
MASLPSYQEATQGPDWLELVAPHVAVKHYARLCRVSSRFYNQFAPRLWNDPLTAARVLGLDPDHDLEWYFRFIVKHARLVRTATRSLVRSLDFRGFATGDAVFSVDASERNIAASFPSLPALFPSLQCILLDGHPEVDPSVLGKVAVPDVSKQSGFKGPHVLSIPHCRIRLPSTFFESPYLRNLVYLDISGIPGSIKSSIAQGLLGPRQLPSLRVLKARGREIDDTTAVALLKTFDDRLWSIDLSRNNLTDAVVDYVVRYSFPSHTLRSDSHFDVEGRVETQLVMGTDSHGPFSFIKESSWSGTFSHSHRYLADAPVYVESHGAGPQEDQHLRTDGRSLTRPDTAESMKAILAGAVGSPIPSVDDVDFLDICSAHSGISHLHLNDNHLSAKAIERLIRASGGRLEHLECVSPSFRVPPTPLRMSTARTGARLSGTVGAAHLFRPLFSPNLQVLRTHHSLVTQVLSVELKDAIAMANIWISETAILERVRTAYPQAFVPDMNPRLRSLTLAEIPRYSSGPVTNALISFLKLASIQERAIQDARVSSRRGPSILPGIRHIHLEFEHDPSQELEDSDGEDFRPEDMMEMAAKDFSFFGDGGWESLPVAEKSQSATEDTARQQSESHGQDSGRLRHLPYTETCGEHVEKACEWNGKTFTVPVWIGPGIRGPHRAVNEYMSLLQDPSLHDAIVPASPCHIAAGVPPGSFIFSAAWDAMLVPTRFPRPSTAEMKGMRDVVAAIKQYRLQTRAAYVAAQEAAGKKDIPLGAPHFHWTGCLEVSVANTMRHYHDSKHWR